MSELLLAALSGVTVWLVLAAAGRRDAVAAGHIAGLAEGDGPSDRRRPVRALLAGLARWLPGTTQESNRGLLEAAGMGDVPAESVRGVQLLLAGAGFLLGLLLGPLAVVASPVGVLVGYRLPHAVLIGRSRVRRDDMAAALPDAVDLLAVCTHAGLNTSLALQRVARHTRGALGREVRRTVQEIELGEPRSRALENLAARVGLPELESLVRVLLNSERFGTQIAGSLENFSSEVRGRRKRAAEEQARRAPVKILFPLVFLILPAFILLTVVPLLVSAFQSLSI